MSGKLAQGHEAGGADASECISSANHDVDSNTSGDDQQPLQQAEHSVDGLRPPLLVASHCVKDSQSRQLILKIAELTKLLCKSHRNPKDHWRVVRTSKWQLKKASIAELSDSSDVRPHAVININGEEINGLLDSGASISCLGRDAFRTLHRCNIKWKELESDVATASGEKQKVIGYADVEVTFQGKIKQIRLYIIPSLAQELYLGVDFGSPLIFFLISMRSRHLGQMTPTSMFWT